MEKNPVIEAILGRRSIRKYQDRPVEDEKINLLIRCAASAPSAGNSCSAHFVVIREKKTLTDISLVHPYGSMLVHASLAVAVCGERDRSDLSLRYWEQDCAAAMENLLVAAKALGLGAVWLGVCHLPDGGESIGRILQTPESVTVMGIASIGYPGEDKTPHSGDPKERLHLERW